MGILLAKHKASCIDIEPKQDYHTNRCHRN
jgi:hypothetical protein